MILFCLFGSTFQTRNLRKMQLQCPPPETQGHQSTNFGWNWKQVISLYKK